MSTASEFDLNLENLFQPAWAQGKEATNRFEKFTGEEGVRPERRYSDKPGERRAPRRDGGGGFGGGRPSGGGGGGRPGGAGGGERRGGPPRGGGAKFGGGDRGSRPGGRFQRDDRRDDRQERPEPLAPLPEFNVAFVPDEKGVEQLARQIKMTGRAYPLFQIALLILQKGERYTVALTPKKKADGTAQKIFVCALDDSPWLSEDEAVQHVLKNHFGTFYQAERTATEPPKGVYTFVAQCGMSGVILGPPNYHDYQNQLRKLHAEKFSRMPFDAFKARVKIVKDEAVVKKWIEEQSFKTEYTCLNVTEPLALPSMEEVEKHFRATHKDAIIKAVDSFNVPGLASRTLKSTGLQRLIRQEWDQQKAFPLPVATKLSQQLAHHGLQFFKVNKTVTHVNVARPQYLDLETTPVSENIKRIVEFINGNAKATRRKLIEALAPTPKAAAAAKPAVAEVKVEAPAAPAAEGGAAPVPEAAAENAAAQAPSAPVAPKAPEATPEQTAVIVDLHWLIHQGHVLEFADGRMETAKKPAPKPVKVEKKTEKPADKPASDKPAEAAPVEAVVEEAAPVEAVVEETAAEVLAEAPVSAEPTPMSSITHEGEATPEAAPEAASGSAPEASNQNASGPPVS